MENKWIAHTDICSLPCSKHRANYGLKPADYRFTSKAGFCVLGRNLSHPKSNDVGLLSESDKLVSNYVIGRGISLRSMNGSKKKEKNNTLLSCRGWSSTNQEGECSASFFFSFCFSQSKTLSSTRMVKQFALLRCEDGLIIYRKTIINVRASS